MAKSRRNRASMAEQLEGRLLLTVTPSLTPNRISGVAPLSVHFDATGTTSTATAIPLHEVEYLWNFGDAGSGNWANSGKSRNSDSGPVAGHVFEQPGTYSVTLNVRDPEGSVASQTVTITVDDPDVVFSGANTIAFSTVGDFADAPAGALQVTTSSLATIASYAAPGKRLLLHRGETWNTSAGVTINQLGPGIVGAYGAGAKPKIVATGTGLILSDPVPHMDDWRIVDLDMWGAPTKAAIVYWGTANNILIDRVDITDFGSGITGSPSRLDFWNNNGNPGHTLHDGTAIVNTNITHGQGGQGLCGIFLLGRRMLMMGSSVTNMEDVEHTVRMTWLQKTVLSHNLIGKPAVAKHNLKLHAPQFEELNTLGYHQYSEQIVVSNNTFDAGTNAWIVGIGPQDSQKDERVRDVIFQKNFLPATASTQVGLKIWAQQVTARNNIFTLFRDWDVGIGIERRGVEPAPANNYIYNNTIYSPTNTIYGVWIDTTASNTTAKNNLVKGYQAVRNLGTASVVSNNLLTATPNFVSAAPVNAADFALRVNSPARDAGAATPLWNDFDGQARPLDLYDIGAWEMVDTTAPTATIGTPTGSPADSLTISFSEAVTGFDLADLALSRNGGANLLTVSQSLTTTDNKNFVLGNLSGLIQTAGSYTLTLAAGTSGIADLPGNAMASSASQNWQAFASVAGRWIFYNTSYWDGNDLAANALDDAAIAPNKSALLPGQTATFSNYTSYSRGINGIMIDVLGLPESGLSAGDFIFRVGNDSLTPDPTTWATAAAPRLISIRRGAGASGSDRVELLWDDNVIQKQWLQVTLLAGANSGLAADDVFYFGNAVGESGNSTTSARVDSSDEIGARQNPKTPSNPATITDLYDYNRDHLVNSVDQLIARNNKTTPSTELKLIQTPA